MKVANSPAPADKLVPSVEYQYIPNTSPVHQREEKRRDALQNKLSSDKTRSKSGNVSQECSGTQRYHNKGCALISPSRKKL
jgi:hypothetical protein